MLASLKKLDALTKELRGLDVSSDVKGMVQQKIIPIYFFMKTAWQSARLFFLISLQSV